MDIMAVEPKIVLARMPQQEEVRSAEDDWTGSTDAAERRKRQNRIHQRLFRKRRREKNLEQARLLKSGQSSLSSDGHSSSSPSSECSTTPTLESLLASRQTDTFLNHSIRAHLNSVNNDSQHIDHIIHDLERSFLEVYKSGSPRSDMLLTLIQFNVFRALVQNTFISGLGFSWLECEAVSLFNTEIRDWKCPPALQPTELQRKVEHHPWIDIFPFPALRDNMLRQGEDYDDTDLCYDLVELCHAPAGRNGLIIWGESWDPTGWEVTESFVKKWGWMLRGCRDLLWSTNMWRRKRGEAEIYFDTRPVEELD